MTYNIDPGQGLYCGTSTAPVSMVHESQKAHFLFWGLVPVSTPDITELSRKFCTGPDQYIADIEIREENTFVDGFLAAITYGIYRPRTIVYSAKVYNKSGGGQI